MNNPSKAAVEARKNLYKPGSRVELISMADPYTTLTPGERGTVETVDDIGTVHIKWDCGSSLGAAYGADQIKLLPASVSDTVKEQILAIRATGKTNMFDANSVQNLAFYMGFYELVDFIETDRKAYSKFLLTGGRDDEDA